METMFARLVEFATAHDDERRLPTELAFELSDTEVLKLLEREILGEPKHAALAHRSHPCHRIRYRELTCHESAELTLLYDQAHAAVLRYRSQGIHANDGIRG